MRRTLRFMQVLLFATAFVMLAYCAFVMIDAWHFQKTERRQFDLSLAASSHVRAKTSPPPVMGGLVGRMEIPRLGLSAIVMEGTGPTTLRRAVGHIEGTAMPGQVGNVGLSGHRDTFFRPLRNIRRNDIITVTTLTGDFRYRVISTRIVGPDDVSVLKASGREILTLVTCYPFYFVGAAPDRFIVTAERIS